MLFFFVFSSITVFSQRASVNEGCIPLRVQFTGSTGDWDFGDGAQVLATADPVHTYTSEGVFYVSYNGNVFVGIIVNTPPVVDAGNDQKICFGGTAVLNGSIVSSSNGGTYYWTPVDSIVGSSNIASPTTKSLSRTTKFYLTLKDGNGCTAQDSVRVVLNPLVAMAGQSVDVCNESTFTPSYSVVGGFGASSTFQYAWTPSQGITGSNTDKPIFKASNTGSVAETKNVLFTVIDSLGCKSSSQFSYSVRPRFKFNNYTDLQTCYGSWANSVGEVSNAEGTPSNFTYTWTPSTANISNPYIANPSFRGVGKTIYKLKVIDEHACKDSTNLTVNVFTPIQVEAGTVKTVCYNNAANLKGTVSGGVGSLSYYWSPSSLIVDTLLLTTDTKPLLSSEYVFLNVTDSKACVRKDSVKLSVDIPTPSIQNKLDVCAKDSMKLIGTATGGVAPYRYIWKMLSSDVKLADDDGLSNADVSDSIAQPRFLAVAKGGHVVYTLLVKDKLGCYSPKKAFDSITVRALPVLSDKEPFIFCFEDVKLMNLIADSGYVSYKWSTGANTRTIQVSNEGNYHFTVTDKYGCKQSDSLHVYAKCSPRIYVPDAFSPNGDAVNDVFMFFGRYYTNASMKIFNRWGELIFLINNETPSWDGTVKGVPVEPGSYPYTMEYSGVIDSEVYHKQGVIHVVR